MQLTMEQRILIVKSYCETKSYNQVQNKFRNHIFKCEDHGEVSAQEHKKTLKQYGKHWKEIKEE